MIFIFSSYLVEDFATSEFLDRLDSDILHSFLLSPLFTKKNKFWLAILSQ